MPALWMDALLPGGRAKPLRRKHLSQPLILNITSVIPN
jgi:hypothetical protein